MAAVLTQAERLNAANQRLTALLDRLRPSIGQEDKALVDTAREALNRAAEKLSAMDIEWAEQALDTAHATMQSLSKRKPLYYYSVDGI